MARDGSPVDWYHQVLDTLAEIVVVIDTQGHLVWANRSAQVLLGYEVAEHIGKSVLDWVHPDDLEEAARMLDSSMTQGYAWPMAVRVRRIDGIYLTMDSDGFECVSADLRQYVLSLRIIQPTRTPTVGDSALSPLVVILHHVSDAVVAIGPTAQVVFRNRAAIDLFRIGVTRVVDALPANVELVPVDAGPNSPPYREPFGRVACGEKVPRHEVRVLFSDESERVVEVTGEPFTSASGEPAGGVVAFRDVTELRRQEAELRRLALRDSLTGLANRTELMAHMRAKLAECLLRGGHVVVMFVDLDRFKDINDTYDHLVGDEVLQVTAQRLVECVGPDGLVARFGGEEFVIVTAQSSDEADALALHIVERMREPIATAAGIVSTSCSVGLAVGTGATEPEQLLREADTAVYAAKRMGGSTKAWYERTQRERAVGRVRAFRGARLLVEATSMLRYRPVIELVTGEVCAIRLEVPEADRHLLSEFSAVDRRLIVTLVEHVGKVDAALSERFGEGAPPVIFPVPAPVLAQRALLGEIEYLLSVGGPGPGRRIIDTTMFGLGPAAVAPEVFTGYAVGIGAQFLVDDPHLLMVSALAGVDLALWAVRLPRELVRRLPAKDRATLRSLRAFVELAAAHDARLAADRVDSAEQRQCAVALGVAVAWGDAMAPATGLTELLEGPRRP